MLFIANHLRAQRRSPARYQVSDDALLLLFLFLILVVRRDVVFVLTLHHELPRLAPTLRPPLEQGSHALALAKPTRQALAPLQRLAVALGERALCSGRLCQCSACLLFTPCVHRSTDTALAVHFSAEIE